MAMVSSAMLRQLLSGRRARYSVGGIVAAAGVLGTFVLAPSPAHERVLAAARQLPPGTVLTRADLSTTDSATPGEAAVSADREDAFLGRTLSFGLPAGALLAPGDVGRFPPAGYMVVSRLLSAGQYPQDLAVGQKVAILPLAADGSASSAVSQAATGAASGAAAASGVIPGELLALTASGGSQDETVAELLVGDQQAAQVASAPGVVLLGTAGAGL